MYYSGLEYNSIKAYYQTNHVTSISSIRTDLKKTTIMYK